MRDDDMGKMTEDSAFYLIESYYISVGQVKALQMLDSISIHYLAK